MEAAIRGIIISLSILKNTAPGIPVTKQNNNTQNFINQLCLRSQLSTNLRYRIPNANFKVPSTVNLATALQKNKSLAIAMLAKAMG